MIDTTLVFLIKKNQGKITDICLAMKKRGFGVGRWNGVGGKIEKGETIEKAAKRETQEEIFVSINKLRKVAELSFYFSYKQEWDQKVHVYFSEKWTGEPKESEEMRPQWFSVKDIPYQEMWSDDIFWFPKALEGKLLKAKFTFGENDVVQEQEVNIVNKF